VDRHPPEEKKALDEKVSLMMLDTLLKGEMMYKENVTTLTSENVSRIFKSAMKRMAVEKIDPEKRLAVSLKYPYLVFPREMVKEWYAMQLRK
jgi:hypothetical protein